MQTQYSNITTKSSTGTAQISKQTRVGKGITYHNTCFFCPDTKNLTTIKRISGAVHVCQKHRVFFGV